MKKEILSLKSLYKFLTANDYPVYSERIIKKDNCVGLTLTKFCHENILVDFKNRKNGKIIWRTEGGRNRYISEICNRSSRLGLYKEYPEEMADAADAVTVFRQIRQFMTFLSARQYNYKAFCKRFPAYIALLGQEDEGFSEDAAAFFQKAMEEMKQAEGQGAEVYHFCCGWVLTFLMFQALIGNAEGEIVLRELRADKTLSLSEMRKYISSEGAASWKQAAYLTNTNTELNCIPLKPGHFFGREAEMFEIRELLSQGGKYLISGIGGCGKTELMRQFIRCCEEEGLVDYICVVQYEGSLAKSFVNAFPDIHGADLKENFQNALGRIRAHADKRVLVAIDNMDGEVEDTEVEALRKLPVTVFVTTRYQKLKGFKTYKLKAIGREAGSLIFRDNYGNRLEEEDKKILEQMLSNDMWCHTLTLRLLARTARNNGWSLSKLSRQLESGNVLSNSMNQERYESLKQVYCNMYALSGLTTEARRLLRMFALLPYKNYKVSFIKSYLKGFLGAGADMEEFLESFWSSGWLEKKEDGYAMHPVISECVLSISATEEECRPFLESVLAAWERIGKKVSEEYIPDVIYNWDNEYKKISEELLQVTMLVRPLGGRLSGKFSVSFVRLFLLAAVLESSYYGASGKGLDVLQKVLKRAEKLPEALNICYHIMLFNYGYGNTEVLENYKKQLEKMDVSARMKYTYDETAAIRYYHLGQHDKAEVLIDNVLENCKDEDIRISASIVKANLLMQKGDFSGYEKWLLYGIELGRTFGREKSKNMQLLLCGLCSLYLAYGKFTEAEQILDELQNMTKVKNFHLEHQILFYRGSLEMHRGDEGYGIKSLKEACRYAEILYQDVDELNYAVTIVELAMAQNKAKQYEETVESYKKALAIYDAVSGHEFEKHRILNNMGVMYLDREQYEDALECLNNAHAMAKLLGGLAEAETVNNLSKTWRGLKDRKKELRYLEQALPILEQFYGAQHPKVVDAKARIMDPERH